jgi:hypothetical protein
MDKLTKEVLDQPLEIAVVQCSIAFGQGAGMIAVSAEVVPEMIELFRPLIAHHLQSWQAESGRILNIAEALGRAAAGIAVRAGKLKIDLVSIKMATQNLGSKNCLPLA